MLACSHWYELPDFSDDLSNLNHRDSFVMRLVFNPKPQGFYQTLTQNNHYEELTRFHRPGDPVRFLQSLCHSL
jgi:hypothetical protein